MSERSLLRDFLKPVRYGLRAASLCPFFGLVRPRFALGPTLPIPPKFLGLNSGLLPRAC